jgi:hypothetical protein
MRILKLYLIYYRRLNFISEKYKIFIIKYIKKIFELMSIGTSIVDPIQKDNYNWLGVMDFIQVNLNS